MYNKLKNIKLPLMPFTLMHSIKLPLSFLAFLSFQFSHFSLCLHSPRRLHRITSSPSSSTSSLLKFFFFGPYLLQLQRIKSGSSSRNMIWSTRMGIGWLGRPMLITGKWLVKISKSGPLAKRAWLERKDTSILWGAFSKQQNNLLGLSKIVT
jgi:hypothetical protein